MENSPVKVTKTANPADDGKAAERYFIIGVLASIVVAVFGGIYLIAGKF